MDRSAVNAVAALSDPTRAAVFESVQDARHPITREAVADAVGISHKLAAFHLDRLVAAGLLRADTAAPARRVGRAPKIYWPSERHVQVSVPPRDHESLAEVLLVALTETAQTCDTAMPALARTATDRGRARGIEVADQRRFGRLGPERALTVLTDVLNQHGYRAVKDQHSVVLRNCPFQPLAARNPGAVCGMNHAFIAGLIDGLQARGVTAVLAPDPAGCCVQVRRVSAEADRPVADRTDPDA